MSDPLRLALPSSGALYQSALDLLSACGLAVHRTNLRRYTAEIRALPGVVVSFQRGSDITAKIEEGSADIGIVGKDRFLESRRGDGDTRVVLELGFGRSQLVMAAPDSWVDVTSVADLADLSVEFRDQGEDLRVATKYPRLTERHLLDHGVNYFSLVQSSGTLEAAPAMGFADVVADITESGTTLRENHLKQIHGGSIIQSQACLVSRRFVDGADGPDGRQLASARALAEMIEAHLAAKSYYSITANMHGESADEVGQYILAHAEISGLRGPSISAVHAQDSSGWYAVTVIVEQERLLSAVEQLRGIGGTSVTVSKPDYVFHSTCQAHERLT
ncbi:MAG: ATP phosphoribosyltransferase [SAR202 cluster bacterium]|jgi:ATP phosphoribosyltransferase|nr:ATP phosphoribosyltransferase [Chloroflexota bacterium]MDP6420314.1 ATP phosphoribosyltransferase [SAR202 cluster bacterium]HAL46464.1 ATP phosphoribosyltransferase [Dehalococcoidia bacterium]MDP6665368.1 ATP phosphoribosyltransferase [SAR202 cluster bacterium]MDP6801084.1 ATP phosphoribosyltransferase [SAR202 cluster bacterium]|tara:strand:+ start:327 stop:1322 length:996 start_codon:yes stop_codon:yes gene_type:complete